MFNFSRFTAHIFLIIKIFFCHRHPVNVARKSQKASPAATCKTMWGCRRCGAGCMEEGKPYS